MVKCAHTNCFNKSSEGIYCSECVQSPMKECSFCNCLGLTIEDAAIANEIAETKARHRIWVRDWTRYGYFFIIVLWVIFIAFALGWIK